MFSRSSLILNLSQPKPMTFSFFCQTMMVSINSLESTFFFDLSNGHANFTEPPTLADMTLGYFSRIFGGPSDKIKLLSCDKAESKRRRSRNIWRAANILRGFSLIVILLKSTNSRPYANIAYVIMNSIGQSPARTWEMSSLGITIGFPVERKLLWNKKQENTLEQAYLYKKALIMRWFANSLWNNAQPTNDCTHHNELLIFTLHSSTCSLAPR